LAAWHLALKKGCERATASQGFALF